MRRFTRLPLLGLVLVATLLVGTVWAAPSNASRRRNNAQRSAAQKRQALDAAISATKSRVQAAQQAHDVLAAQAMKRQMQAGGSGGRFENAKADLATRKHEADGALSEVKELQYRIERAQEENSPFVKAKAAYEAAVEELAEARLEIYKSLDYQAEYAKADAAANRLDKIDEVTRKFYDEDQDYQAARERVQNAKRDFEREKLAIYQADPAWVEAVKKSRESKGAETKAETTFGAAAMEKGIEGINARDAQRRLAAAQALLADAKGDLQRLESQKKKMQPSKPATSTSQAKKKK